MTAASAVVPERRSRTVAGRTVEYHEAGSGPPLVLLHANGETAGDWRWTMPALARDHRVIALGLPGMGGTAPTEDYRPETLAAWLVEVLDGFDLPAVTLVGNSLGGLLALQTVLDHPARVQRVVVLGAAGLGRAVNPALALETPPHLGEVAVGTASLAPGGSRLRAALRAPLLFARPWRAPSAWWADQVEHGSRRSFVAATLAAHRATLDLRGQRHVLLDRLPEVEVPVLLLWGSEDRVVPVVHGREAVRRLRDGHLEVLHGAGHLPHVECPDAVTTALLAWLEEHQPG